MQTIRETVGGMAGRRERKQGRKMNADRTILWLAGHGNSVHGWSLVIGGRVANQVDAAELLPKQTLDPLMQNEMLPIRRTLVC